VLFPGVIQINLAQDRTGSGHLWMR